jgi:HSP20 family protein
MSCCTPSTLATPDRASQEDTTPATYRPRLDVIEKADAYEAIVEIPGAGKDDVELTLEDGVLRIHAKVAGRDPDGRNWRRREYGTGDFVRTLRVGDAIDAERIGANVENGLLMLSLPKAEAAKPRSIRIG